MEWDPSQDDVGVAGYYVYGDKGRATVTTLSDSPVVVVTPSYEVKSLGCGQSATIAIEAFDVDKIRSDRVSTTVSTAACQDVRPPTTPSGFRQPATTRDSVVLAWDASSDDVGVVGYGVYRNLQRIASPAEPAATLDGLSCGVTYNYAVDAVDAAGNRSPLGTAYVQTASCGDVQPPSAPANLTVTSRASTSLSVSWSSSSDNVGVAGYRLSVGGAPVATVSQTNATLLSLSCGMTYAVGVDAFDAAGNRSLTTSLNVATDACASSSGDATPPSSPTGLTASNVTQTGLTLAWNVSSDNIGVAAYDVYRNGTKIASVTSTSSGQTGLSCGTSYTLAVVARDAAGNSSQPAQIDASTSACSPSPSADTTAPSQPTNLTLSGATLTSVTLTWGAASDNVGVTGYRTYVNGSAGATTIQLNATVSSLACGTAYTFEVDAFDVAGNRSTRVSVIGSTSACPDSQPPSAPASIVATSRTATSIALSWSASSDNVAVTGYGLYRSGSAVGSSAITTGIFSGLTCSTNYTLAVDAYDAAGNRSSQTVVMVSTTACPDTTPPSIPTGLSASNVSQTGLTLTWNASSDSVGVTGYDVYRNGTKITTVTSTSSSQTGLACATSYSFGIIAFDAAGNRSPQAQLSASTPACSAPPPPVTSSSFDELGNTFSGQNYDQVPHGAQAMAVAPDGMVVTGANWIESGHEVKVYDANGAYGPRTGLHDGTGAPAVAITNTHLYAVHGGEIVRWARSTFIAGDNQNNRRSVGGTLTGIAVSGNEVYVSNLSTIQVLPADLSGGVIRSFPAPGARFLAADRQGNIWALQSPNVVRYSPTGTQLASFAPAGTTVGIGTDPMSDTLLVTDNGPDQRIEKYSYAGVSTGTFGIQGGYLAGPTPGLIGPQRFVGPRGVGMDTSGNVYVAQNGHPGVSTAVSFAQDQSFGRLLILESYNSAGARRWHLEGMMFVDTGEPSPDSAMFYTREMSYERQADGRYHPRAFTMDPWAHPNDSRIITAPTSSSVFENTSVRDVQGHRFLLQFGASGGLRILRMQGEIAVPSAFISGNPANDYIQVEGLTRENRPSGFPDVIGRDFWMDTTGDVWRLGEDSKIARYKLQGFTGAGNPIYHYANTDILPLPSQLANVRQIEVYGSSIYISGYAPGTVPSPSEFDSWKWTGDRIVKFSSLPSGGVWPTPAWNVAIHYQPGVLTGPPADRPIAWAADPTSNLLAIGYQVESASAPLRQPYLRFYSLANGAETRIVHNSDFPAAYGERGWLDIFRAVKFVNGWVWMEEDQLSKQVGVKA